MSSRDKDTSTFKILADVNIKDGDVHISNIDAINFPNQPKAFNIDIDSMTDLTADNIQNKIINKIIGDYKYSIPNCYINQHNTIILFINNHWLIYFTTRDVGPPLVETLWYITYTPTKDVAYMDIRDITLLFAKENIVSIRDGKPVKVTTAIKNDIEPLFKKLVVS